MNLAKCASACLVLFPLMAAPVGAEVASTLQYSADSTFETAAGAVSGHVNVAPGMERRETLNGQETMKRKIVMTRNDGSKMAGSTPTHGAPA